MNSMRAEIITHHACSHCRTYARQIAKYIPTQEYDISVSRKIISAVPYTFVYDGDTLITEWKGATLEPLFACMEGPKMKVRFTITCRDKYTGTEYKKSTVKEFPDQRANELIAAGVAVEVKPRKKNDQDNDNDN